MTSPEPARVTIREATPDDANELARLRWQLYRRAGYMPSSEVHELELIADL